MRSAVLRRTQSHVIRGSATAHQLGQRGLATARPLQGMLNYDEFKRAVEAEELDTVIVAFTDLTGRQLGKRYDAEYVLDHYHDFESHACDYLLTIGVDMNPLDGFKAANWFAPKIHPINLICAFHLFYFISARFKVNLILSKFSATIKLKLIIFKY
jgi:hypothetical protein